MEEVKKERRNEGKKEVEGKMLRRKEGKKGKAISRSQVWPCSAQLVSLHCFSSNSGVPRARKRIFFVGTHILTKL